MSIADFLNPQSAPPQTPSEEAELRNAWRGWLTPDNRAAMFQFGIQMLQPLGRGQTLAGQFGQAAGMAGETLAARSDQRVAQSKEALANQVLMKRLGMEERGQEWQEEEGRSRLEIAREQSDLTRRGQDIQLYDLLNPDVGTGRGGTADLRDNWATVGNDTKKAYNDLKLVGQVPMVPDGKGGEREMTADEFFDKSMSDLFPGGTPTSAELLNATPETQARVSEAQTVLNQILGVSNTTAARETGKDLVAAGADAPARTAPSAPPKGYVPPAAAAPVVPPPPTTVAPITPVAPLAAPAPVAAPAAPPTIADPTLAAVAAEAQAAIASGDPAKVQMGQEALRRIQQMMQERIIATPPSSETPSAMLMPQWQPPLAAPAPAQLPQFDAMGNRIF